VRQLRDPGLRLLLSLLHDALGVPLGVGADIGRGVFGCREDRGDAAADGSGARGNPRLR
jgi:hypothetical protein